jgi:uncharacterized spore protein YtfJ
MCHFRLALCVCMYVCVCVCVCVRARACDGGGGGGGSIETPATLIIKECASNWILSVKPNRNMYSELV